MKREPVQADKQLAIQKVILQMLEYCDSYDAAGRRTGRTVVRGTVLSQGEYYLAVHVWIRNQAGEYLVQQRALQLAADPGVWATTVGYVQAGEESSAGAVREVQEELGLQLDPEQLGWWRRVRTGSLLQDVWLADVERQAIGAPALSDDVAAWRWISRDALRQLIAQGDFFAYRYFADLPE